MKTAAKVRWGILGCARIAERALIPAIRAARNGELVGIAARDPVRAREWAGRHGFKKAYRDYPALLADPEVEAVYNPLPNHLHAPWTTTAARAGKHVLCEKPLAINAAEVQAIAREAERAGVLVLEAFMYRFHPQFVKALEVIRSGRLGRVQVVRSSFTFAYLGDEGNFRWNRRFGGGSLYDVGCYPVSAARTVFEAEPISVFARAVRRLRRGVDLAAALLLEFPGDRFALCDSGFAGPFQSRLEAAGPEGRLVLNRAFSPKHYDVEVEVLEGDARSAFPIPATDHFRLMVEHFGEAVLKGRPLRYGLEEALGQARTLDAAFASMKTGLPAKVARASR